jgi:multiple sugar transport system ATP-binding protein
MTATAPLEVQGLTKRFPIGSGIRRAQVHAVDDVSFELRPSTITALVGESGSGKSTVARLLAHLYEPTSGEVRFEGDDVSHIRKRREVLRYRSQVQMIFQDPFGSLNPVKTIRHHLARPLQIHRIVPRAQVEERVHELLRTVGLVPPEQIAAKYPYELSGGQRQRVAMGRAIVRNPKVFLFDEPLSNLDAKLRVQMRIEIKKVHQKVRTTTVYVTHDQVEAMTLADRVVVMNHGRIEQIGTPNELYHSPATRFVAGFIGSPAMNFIPCRLEDVAGKLHIRLTDRISFPLPPRRAARYQGVARNEKLLLGLRPEHIAEAKTHPEPGVEAFDAVLDVTEPMGMETLIYFTLEGAQICGRVNPNAGAHDGGPMRLAVDLNNMHLLNEVTGVVL